MGEKNQVLPLAFFGQPQASWEEPWEVQLGESEVSEKLSNIRIRNKQTQESTKELEKKSFRQELKVTTQRSFSTRTIRSVNVFISQQDLSEIRS